MWLNIAFKRCSYLNSIYSCSIGSLVSLCSISKNSELEKTENILPYITTTILTKLFFLIFLIPTYNLLSLIILLNTIIVVILVYRVVILGNI